MESENETRPLLTSFESDTWRSRARRRCLRIPVEVTITGVILGLFLVVVTLLILFENLQTTQKEEIQIDDTLLASPFKYNKKAQDKTWQNKKDYVKTKVGETYNGRKVVPDPAGGKRPFGILQSTKYGKGDNIKEDDNDLYQQWKEEFSKLSIISDEYGKEIDDSTETLPPLDSNDGKPENRKIKSMLLTSKVKWQDVDEGWNKLSEQGWKDKDITIALFKALKERKEAQTEGILQSSINYDEFWKEVNDNWKKSINEGNNQINKQKTINDEWKNKMNKKEEKQVEINNRLKDKMNKKAEKQEDINSRWKDKANIKAEKQENINNQWMNKMNHFQSPKSENLSEQDMENKAIEAALISAWKEKSTSLKSPINLQDIWGKATSMLHNLVNEGMDKKGSDKSTKGEPAKEMKILQASEAHDKNQNFNASEILSKYGLNDVKIDIIDGMDLKTFLITVIQTIKDLQKEQNKKDGDADNTEKQKQIQSSMSLDNVKWKSVDDGWKTLVDQGWEDKELKEAVYRAWKDSHKLMQSAMGNNNMKWKKVDDGWKKIHNKSVEVPTRCPFKHRPLTLSASMPEARVDCALIAEELRKEFGRCIDLSFLPKECKPAWSEKCVTSYKYRKIDGTCNNKIHPTWGKSGTPFVRMIAPDYSDGVSGVRSTTNGEPLPNARHLSTQLYSKKKKPDSNSSVLFLYFGLFVDHDLSETSTNSNSIPCCDEDFQKYPQSKPKECLEIYVPNGDPFYGPRSVTCLNLVRSAPVNGECAGRREQLNKATAFLDGSAVYGPNIKITKQLRTFSRGQLKTQLIYNSPFMSVAQGNKVNCGTPDEPHKCFEAGDSRVNMLVELSAMHALWYREHNRIATELHKINPQWTDEVLFQEARRILIGELQHIVFTEFLPILLGAKAMEDYDLKLEESEIYDGYDDTVDPSIFNVFAAAAFRFGHSIVPDTQIVVGADNSTKKIALHDTFFNNEILFHDGFDSLLKGAALQRTQSVDIYITRELREHLFQAAKADYGHDLAAVGIQRGRDHGLPSYARWRSVCGLSEIKTWNDLYKVMDNEHADALKNVYQSVEDVDLIPGALAEHHVEGAFLGETYLCVIGRQFKKTRKGDRFWFEIQNGVGSFTKDQLNEIYKSNMARIICDNSNTIKQIQKHSLSVPSAKNPIVDCGKIPKVDLTLWK